MSSTPVEARSAHAARESLDRTEQFGGATVQHGHDSDRAYLVKPGPRAADDVALLERLAAEHGYSKLFAKTVGIATLAFEDAGFHVEARIPSGRADEPLSFCSRFLTAERSLERFPDEVRRALEPRDQHPRGSAVSANSGAQVLSSRDAVELAGLYCEIFESYPFPIDDPSFLCDAMDGGTVFVGVRDGSGRLVAAASAEVSAQTMTCEMTDFATRPENRGTGLASTLLTGLEAEARTRGIRVAYTIARATSASMNRVFARGGYTYAGTLVNNTHISGGIESMNVWFLTLG